MSSLDILIRQQNEAVLGTADVSPILQNYRARRGSAPSPSQPPAQQQAFVDPQPIFYHNNNQPVGPAPPQKLTAAQRMRASDGLPPASAQPAAQQLQYGVAHPMQQQQRMAPAEKRFAREPPPTIPHPMAPPPAFGGYEQAQHPQYPQRPQYQQSQQHFDRPPPTAAPSQAAHTSVRVHKGGSAINSAQMDAALHPARNEREMMRRAGLQPHNHHRDNVTAIKVKQQEQAAKKAYAEQEAQRVDEQRRRARELALQMAAQRAAVGSAEGARRPTLCAKPATVEKHGSYGKVPSYLAERNRRKESEEQFARDEAAKTAGCPPGAREPGHARARAARGAIGESRAHRSRLCHYLARSPREQARVW
jgi:hypothetical protein